MTTLLKVLNNLADIVGCEERDQAGLSELS